MANPLSPVCSITAMVHWQSSACLATQGTPLWLVTAIATWQKTTNNAQHASLLNRIRHSLWTTEELGQQSVKAFAKHAPIKKLTNGKKETVMNTTHTKEHTEPSEKLKVGQLFETISLRDYFAAKAMQAFYTNYENSSDAREASIRAYEIADAMLKAREA